MSPRLAGDGRVRSCCRAARAASSARSNTCRYTSLASMPATHSPSSTATIAMRRFMIGRQLCVAAVAGGVMALLPPGDDGCRRRLRRHDAFDDDRLVAGGRDEMELLRRQRLDPLRRL